MTGFGLFLIMLGIVYIVVTSKPIKPIEEKSIAVGIHPSQAIGNYEYEEKINYFKAEIEKLRKIIADDYSEEEYGPETIEELLDNTDNIEIVKQSVYDAAEDIARILDNEYDVEDWKVRNMNGVIEFRHDYDENTYIKIDVYPKD